MGEKLRYNQFVSRSPREFALVCVGGASIGQEANLLAVRIQIASTVTVSTTSDWVVRGYLGIVMANCHPDKTRHRTYS